MAANKLINFRCPDDLLNAIETYGREKYPAVPNKRGSIEYDQSKAIRDILISGLEALTNGEVKIEKQIYPAPDNKSDVIAAQIIAQFEERFQKIENALFGEWTDKSRGLIPRLFLVS